jgi:hypothetical protein
MTTRRTGWIVGALVIAVVLTQFVPFLGGVVLVLAAPVVVVGSILSRTHPTRQDGRDVAGRLVAVAAALAGESTSPHDDQQLHWGAALRAELATITDPRERRRFAVGAALALLGRPRQRMSFLVAVGAAVVFGAGLLGVSRAGLGRDGLGSVTILLPPAMLFAITYLCARSTSSLRFGLETGIVATLTTLAAVALVYGVEAAHWHQVNPGVSVLDGDHVGVDSTRAAILDALHPVILVVHLVFWSPWPLLGAVAGARAPRSTTG